MVIKESAEQKRVVQTLVYDAIQKHEDKITKGITDEGSRKKLLDNTTTISSICTQHHTKKGNIELYGWKRE